MKTAKIYEYSTRLLISLCVSVFVINQKLNTISALALASGDVTGNTPDVTLPQAVSGQMPAKRMPPPRVRLNKCCHFGEYLDLMQTCMPGSSEHWVPLIWLISRKSYYNPRGQSPKFITFEENMRPIAKHIPTDDNDMNSTSTEQQGCDADELDLFTGLENFTIFSNGSLFVLEHGLLIEPSQFCVDRESALVCLPKHKKSDSHFKIKKCCGKYSTYDAKVKKCVAPTVSNNEIKLPLNESVFQTVYGFPKCNEISSSFAIIDDWQPTLFNTSTGLLQLKHKNLSATEFCLEHLREEDAPTKFKIFACLHHFAPDAPANSISPTHKSNDQLQVAVLNIGIVISVIFLAATLIAGYLMPSVHHVLHWRCQIFYVFCLFIGDLLLAYTQFSSSLELGSSACLLLASAMHFYFLSAFFWLNTMCFNIWWTFRDFRPSSLERNQEMVRLRLYSAYAWGIPLLITVIAAIVDHLPETQLLRPGFGVRSCWFSGDYLPMFAYFFGPVGILLFANIILFVSTTHQLTCGLWKRDDVKSTTEKTALGKVCLKLVVVMGVTWIADIISVLIGGPDYAWFFTDLVNALQGVFIFLVVGCQPQVWAACKRFCCPRSRQEITNTTNGVQHSSSSQGLPSMAACGAEITQNTSINTTIGANQSQAKIPMETVC
ncbi:probable G-protein coupled receptor Mth-like 1 [Teleopsis dalmanni]|uniref:probable G-protein coupled receptor Mth-like 1 n=1 Tax=Teleopsis dalmanni TaxID=139649 RepID=UPI0018CF597C|nr:probable G-protein coupled receptor Mth-like 1 [Teleopsis dalmanni]